MHRVVLIIALLIGSLFAMSDKELAHTIDVAGKQRMLSQKMSKEALLLKIGIDVDKNVKALKETSALFDKTLKGLQKGDKSLNLTATDNKEVQKKLKEAQELWKPFYKNIQDIYNFKAGDEAYIYIEKNNLKLLKKLNEVVSAYAKLANQGGNKLKMANDINLAGKQRMLTQMIAKDLLQYQANLEPKKSLQSLKDSIKLFDKTLNGLYNGDKDLKLNGTKLPKIRKQLDIVKETWSKTKPLIFEAIKQKDNQELTKKVIANLDKTKDEMNKAVGLYAKSINRQKQVLKLNSIINSFLTKKNGAKHLINLAGRQRMLTQRISKLALECTLHLIPESCVRLEQFTKLYEKTLLGFKNGDKELGLEPQKDKKALAQIEKLLKMWKPFADAAIKVQKSNGEDKKALEYILANNEKLLKESNKLVEIFTVLNQKYSNYIEAAQFNLIDMAGRQRMLTQKMTKEYLAINQLGQKEYKPKLDESVTLFDESLNVLINGSKMYGLPKATNPKIKAQLLKIKKIWEKVMPFYHKNGLSKKELVLLLQVNPILLKESNKAVELIENSTEY